MDPKDFLPAPEHWKQILKLPEKVKQAWIRAFCKELKLLIVEKKCFKIAKPREDEPIIPVTAKSRTKIKSDGTVDKLKIRICLRGDLQAALTDFDTWCPMAGYRELKLFLAFAVEKKCKIYQIDFIGAFLHAVSRNRTFTILPEEWKELCPELSEWFGTPLLLLKSVYGSVDGPKNWDNTLKEALLEFGFKQCYSASSIYLYEEGNKFLALTNATDDELLASNSNELRLRFTNYLKSKFDVEDMGQAHWYLQGRLIQNEDFSILLDQSRYMALIAARFLPQFDNTNITTEDREEHQSPLPATFVPTKQDCSANALEVKALEKQHGFQYSSATGMLIYLLNTGTAVQFAIRKLAKFNALPGKKHYKALIHLIHHLRTHKLTYGTKFYPPNSNPPINDLIKRCCPDFDLNKYPIVIFCDSSWQDCVDTGRSTGAYYIYINGSLVTAATFVPTPIAQSSAEAEYNACAYALTDAIHVKQVWNFLHGRHLDAPITFALFTDSKSAIAMIECDHVTRHSRHIERRIHFVKQARMQGMFQVFKIPGEINPADVGTKNLPGVDLKKHLPVIHHRVPA